MPPQQCTTRAVSDAPALLAAYIETALLRVHPSVNY